jgi:hypothetical protein
MKLPSQEREDAFDSSDSEDDMNDGAISLSIDVKKEIIQLVEYRNQCFKDKHNGRFREGRLMDWPITLSRDCKAHIAVYQDVTPPYLLSVSLQDEFNALVSSIACICVTFYANLLHLH